MFFFLLSFFFFFFFNDTATTAIYTLSLHDALPICLHPQLHVVEVEDEAHLHQARVHVDADRREPARIALLRIRVARDDAAVAAALAGRGARRRQRAGGRERAQLGAIGAAGVAPEEAAEARRRVLDRAVVGGPELA